MFRALRTLLITVISVVTTIGLASTAFAHDYTVESGDTLSEIAADYDVPGGWQSIYRWNDDTIDDPDLIYPGQVFELREHRSLSRSADREEPTRDDADKVDKTEKAKRSSSDKVRPATGVITSSYEGGYRSSGGHSGVDIDGSDGNAYAAADGIVESGLWEGDYGNLLKIDHGGGVETWYAHLASFAVSAGQSVEAGQKVGNIGETGNATGPHLHFEVRINGEMTAPLAWLDR